MRKMNCIRESMILLLLIGFTVSLADEKPAGTLSDQITKTSVLGAMEKVVNWQLNNPSRYSAIWMDSTGEMNRMTLLSDGSVLSKDKRERRRNRRQAGLTEPGQGIPQPWLDATSGGSRTISLGSLPPAVQETISRECRDPRENIQVSMDMQADGWEMGALYVGMAALGEVSGKPLYWQALRRMGESLNWRLGERTYNADDHCVGQMYLTLYEKEKHPRMLTDVQSRFDWILKHPPQEDISSWESHDRWVWCDALFMAPPVWAKLGRITGDRRYLDFMDGEWWTTVELLFDKSEHLFYRDSSYFDQRESNGQKVFWSRGNGWVMGALVQLLEIIPEDYPSRPKYISLFKELAARIAPLQPKDGLWHSSLLDAESHPAPETSGSAFFGYAFSWGLRKGILDRKTYWPVIEKTWKGLIRSVRTDGMLGWVQLPGSGPGTASPNTTAPYGTGAFLLVGCELFQLAPQ